MVSHIFVDEIQMGICSGVTVVTFFEGDRTMHKTHVVVGWVSGVLCGCRLDCRDLIEIVPKLV